MNKEMETEMIMGRVRDVIKNHDEIIVGYLYGSFAKGSYDEKSDVDIGLLLKRGYKADPLYESRISLELDKTIGREVEARILNDRDIIFLHQILKYGKLIFSRTERERVRFETYTYSKYLDFLPFYEEYNRVRRERLLQ